MEKSRIYTKTGDGGKTSLVGGARVPKTHVRLEAYGTVDELNACVGLLASLVDDAGLKEQLLQVQHRLFSVGSYLATDQTRTELPEAGRLSEESVLFLERAIDAMDGSLPPLEGFVLPGGSQASALCQVCRTVCRRAERRMLVLENEGECELDTTVKRFINRLSDYLFVLARKLNNLTDKGEIYWDKSCK